jgi:hypothetical protein
VNAEPVYPPHTFGEKMRRPIETQFRCERGHVWREPIGSKPNEPPGSIF